MLTLNVRKRGFLKDGKPFFWLGDTAWLLFQKLDDRQIKTFLKNRVLKGFTVIQATLVHKPGYASPDGARALIDAANAGGGSDNITALLLCVREGGE